MAPELADVCTNLRGTETAPMMWLGKLGFDGLLRRKTNLFGTQKKLLGS